MNTIQRITKNVGVLFISRITGYVLAFLYIMFMARYLGAQGFGVISFALSFTAIFGILADLGLNTLIVREIARDLSLIRKYLNNALAIKIFLSIITVLIVDLSINFLGYPIQTIEVTYFIVLYVIFTSFSQTFYSIFQAYEKMEYQSIGEILNNILMFLGVLAAIYLNLNVLSFAFIYLVSSFIVLIFNIIICSWKFIMPKFEFNIKFSKILTKEALPFGITGIFTTLYVSIDSVMLSMMQGNSAVGLYNAAYRIISLLAFMPAIINYAVFPSMSRFHLSAPKTLQNMVWKYFKIMTMIGVPTVVGITIFADNIIFLIYGTGYQGSVIALQVLIWTTLFVFTNSAFVQLFQSTNKQIIVTKIIGLGTALNIILNLILIPWISYIGAGIATATTELTFTILVIIVTYRTGYGIKINDILLFLLKIVSASLIMCIFLICLKSSINMFLLALSSLILYLIILYLFKVIKRKDILIWKDLFLKR